MKKILLFFFLICSAPCFSAELLPSWNEGPNKDAMIHFVKTVTDKNNKFYVPPEKRIAAFDNDGTLWVEQPIYTQFAFALDRIKKMAVNHPEWKNDATFKKVLQNNILDLTREDIDKIFVTTHSGMTVDAFEKTAADFLNNNRDRRFKRHYVELIYQPMLEVIDYLKKNGFSVYIVSGGGQDFIRSYAEKTYGIHRNHIIGTAGKTKYIFKNQQPVLMKLPEILLIDDKEGKAECIGLFIGMKPIIAFGNSDGDREMLEWTGSGAGKRMMFLVHHDDAVREYAYDKDSKIGTFSESLFTEANKNHWNVISMKNDWRVVFPFEK